VRKVEFCSVTKQEFIAAIRPDAEAALQAQIIDDIATLPENWDGHGAAAISPEASSHARQLLYLLTSLSFLPPPDITPTPSGTIGFTWESASLEAFIEIGRKRCSGYVRTSTRPPILVEGSAGQIDDQIIGASVSIFLITTMNEIEAV
jgi:hypothetical protein